MLPNRMWKANAICENYFIFAIIDSKFTVDFVVKNEYFRIQCDSKSRLSLGSGSKWCEMNVCSGRSSSSSSSRPIWRWHLIRRTIYTAMLPYNRFHQILWFCSNSMNWIGFRCSLFSLLKSKKKTKIIWQPLWRETVFFCVAVNDHLCSFACSLIVIASFIAKQKWKQTFHLLDLHISSSMRVTNNKYNFLSTCVRWYWAKLCSFVYFYGKMNDESSLKIWSSIAKKKTTHKSMRIGTHSTLIWFDCFVDFCAVKSGCKFHAATYSRLSREATHRGLSVDSMKWRTYMEFVI